MRDWLTSENADKMKIGCIWPMYFHCCGVLVLSCMQLFTICHSDRFFWATRCLFLVFS